MKYTVYRYSAYTVVDKDLAYWNTHYVFYQGGVRFEGSNWRIVPVPGHRENVVFMGIAILNAVDFPITYPLTCTNGTQIPAIEKPHTSTPY